MDGQWQAGVGDRIRMEAEKAAIRHLVRMAYEYPEEWSNTRELAVKWKLLPEYTSHLLKVYSRLERKNARSH